MEKKKRGKRGKGCLQKRSGNWWFYYYDAYNKYKGVNLKTANWSEANQLRNKILEAKRATQAIHFFNGNLPQDEIDRILSAATPEPDFETDDELLARQEKKYLKQRVEPLLAEIWTFGEDYRTDTGLYPTWAKQNRSKFTIATYRSTWQKCIQEIPKISRLSDITPNMIKQIGKKRLTVDKVKQETVHQDLIRLKAIFATAIEEQWYTGTNPIGPLKFTKKRNKVVKYLTAEEVKILLTAAERHGEETHLFIAIGLHAGLRKGEIVNLRWEDIDMDEELIHIQAKKENKEKGIQEFNPKSGKTRTIPLKTELKNILLQYKKATGYLIRPQKENKRDFARSNYCIPITHKKIADETGIKFSPHLLRHTFASHAAIAGVSIYKLQKWLGHSTIEMTQIYAHLQAYDDDINF